MHSIGGLTWRDSTLVQGSFLGRQASGVKQRSASALMGGAASRSFVFRTDDSNSAMGAARGEGAGEKVRSSPVLAPPVGMQMTTAHL